MLLGELNSQQLADFKNPFSKDCVNNIFFHINPNITSKYRMNATVKFINNNTIGEQNFFADDFVTLVKNVENFIQSL